jgi:hypothetical protein
MSTTVRECVFIPPHSNITMVTTTTPTPITADVYKFQRDKFQHCFFAAMIGQICWLVTNDQSTLMI